MLRRILPIVLALPIAATAVRAGAAPSAPAVTGGDELPQVLLSRQLMETEGLEVGDVVRLSADHDGDGALPFRIAAGYEPVADPFRFTAKRLEARLHLPDLIALTARPGDPLHPETVTRINVALADPASADVFARELSTRMPGLVLLPTRPRSEPFVVLERFHTAIAVVTVIGSSAFLLALMVMRADERRQTAGILRLIGLGRPRILLEGFIEGLLISVLGAAFGVLLAWTIQGPFNRFFQWRYDTTLVFVRVTAGIAWSCVALAVPLGVLAGLAASWALLRRNIMGLLRR